MNKIGRRSWAKPLAGQPAELGRSVPLTQLAHIRVTRICPDCGKEVLVGGPYQGQWTILRHAPGNDVSVSCLGTEKKIPV